jgi:hypothetical protein
VPIEKFSVSYERSGGLAAMSQKVAIKPGRRGEASASTGHETRAVRFRPSVLKVKQLRNGLSDPRFKLLESSPSGSCADCYVYSLVYREHSVSIAEPDVPVWLAKTIGRLEALVETHLPFH